MTLQLAKGVRDSKPQEQIVRQKIADAIKAGFERYGFLPLDTPVIERADVLSSKYAGGAEILKEMFTLSDQGNRELALRYDLTVPLCRFVGMNPTVKMPFKRYQMGPVFRDGPIKLGRYREFWQIDADIVGAKNMVAEAELITLAFDVFKDLNIPVRMELNNRKVLDAILVGAGVTDSQQDDFILSIDKLKKIGEDKVAEELQEKGFSQEQIDTALSLLKTEGSNKDKLAILKQRLDNTEGLDEIEQVFDFLGDIKVDFTPSLARGLAYYTGTIYEMFLTNSEIKSSCAAGGRYDTMISQFLQSKKEFPAVGISFGLEIIKDALPTLDLSVAQLFVIPMGTLKESKQIAKKLRDSGLKVDLDIMGRGLSKNLNYANSLQIPYVLIIGEDELSKKLYTLRDMKSGEQELLSVDDVIKKLE